MHSKGVTVLSSLTFERRVKSKPLTVCTYMPPGKPRVLRPRRGETGILIPLAHWSLWHTGSSGTLATGLCHYSQTGTSRGNMS